MDVGTLSGAGAIRAHGGNESQSGAGGGGRVAVYYTDISAFDTNNITANGGATGGGVGTVCLVSKAGPIKILDSAPDEGDFVQPTDEIRVRFLFEIDASTFTSNDVALTGPSHLFSVR